MLHAIAIDARSVLIVSPNDMGFESVVAYVFIMNRSIFNKTFVSGVGVN